MREALYNETAGYYMRLESRIWGRLGDYRTSPERSELFAGTFARYVAELFDQLGRPATFHFIECGPGDGSFAKGLLTSLKSFFPDVYAAINYLIDDVFTHRAPPVGLARFQQKIRFVKLASLEKLNCGIVFSNELLDAFPVHRVMKKSGELLELYVGLDSSDNFECVPGPLSTPRLSEIYVQDAIETVDDQIIEISPDIDDWLTLVAEKLQRGYVITVDYGAEASELYGPERREGTLRAFSRHQFVEVLERPGEHDITAHVNWTRVQAVGKRVGLEPVLFERQDKFLLNVGILHELERRSDSETSDAQRLRLSTGARSMLLPDDMASSFQVLVQRRIS
jgi:SAM-dependent MidA family methyltransferase